MPIAGPGRGTSPPLTENLASGSGDRHQIGKVVGIDHRQVDLRPRGTRRWNGEYVGSVSRRSRTARLPTDERTDQGVIGPPVRLVDIGASQEMKASRRTSGRSAVVGGNREEPGSWSSSSRIDPHQVPGRRRRECIGASDGRYRDLAERDARWNDGGDKNGERAASAAATRSEE